jgi:outer membrane protein assembly factor BamA
MPALVAVLAAAAVSTGGLDWLALPIASYNSDDGLAGGAVIQAQWTGDVKPYRASLAAQVLFTTRGIQSHYLRLDVPHLFGTGLRLWLDGEYHRELYAPYYGLGNFSSDSPAAHPGLTSEHPFSYERRYPQAFAALTIPIDGEGTHIEAFSRYLHIRNDPYPGSLFTEERPPGAEGGDELSFGGGILVDRRDGEAVPRGGYLLELAVRGASRGFVSRHTYGGLTARAMGFVPIVPRRIVVALRVMGDGLTKDAPLFELGRFGGLTAIEGIGGESSVRGVPKQRYIGRIKAMSTAELRVRVADGRLLDRVVSFGLVAFVDTGRVWQLDGTDRRFFEFHSGSGGGLRIWHREFVVRVDVATSDERPVNFYFTFGNFF